MCTSSKKFQPLEETHTERSVNFRTSTKASNTRHALLSVTTVCSGVPQRRTTTRTKSGATALQVLYSATNSPSTSSHCLTIATHAHSCRETKCGHCSTNRHCGHCNTNCIEDNCTDRFSSGSGCMDNPVSLGLQNKRGRNYRRKSSRAHGEGESAVRIFGRSTVRGRV